jgi:aspartokinase
VETIAVYWEDTIKTYGIRPEKDLCLLQADISLSSLPGIGEQLMDLGRRGAPVRLIMAQPHPSEALRLFAVFAGGWQDRLADFFSETAFASFCNNLRIVSPVAMLNFQGPHFGDRYGIAAAANDALAKEKISYIAMGCSAASVYVVLPADSAEKARKALATVFKTP